MPTYEYKCGNCGHRFEKFFTKITESSSIECPRCEGLAERLISGGAGLVFKGSGFYITDYRSDSYKEGAKNEEKPAKSEAKPEASKPETAKPSSAKKQAPPKKDSK
ncbi:MAG: hypothetical protein AMS21_05595 [Gemmatimonas sp. SG8_38_2]|nr:MAG: hypothetical protein AMS21_05595 [Gemmatimonas sp. SG8_38_2]